jgi:hypothetical protein
MSFQEEQDVISSLEEEIIKVSNPGLKENLKELLENYKESSDRKILSQIQKTLYKFAQVRRFTYPDVLEMPGWEKEGLPFQRLNGS